MKVIYVDTLSREVAESPKGGLPEGWLLPPLDVSQDAEREIPPRGVVLACSSEESFRERFREKLAGGMK